MELKLLFMEEKLPGEIIKIKMEEINQWNQKR